MSNAPYTLHLGDCLEALRGMPDNSVDSIVTDPPYGLSFMGKKWDYDVPATAVWTECLRVLKPGGHLLAFAGTRTQHRMAVRIEDSGFEIRDMIAWVYGSGFPKSRNIANDMDGESASDWQGWGTALKPALEPITVARKPLVGTVAANVLAHGTGALNIDGSRVGSGADKGVWPVSDRPTERGSMAGPMAAVETDAATGRWPANLIHDGSDEVLDAFPQAPGQQADVSHTAPSDKTSNVYGAMKRVGEPSQDSDNEGAVGFKMKPGVRRLDAGSVARFFYCAKASRADRDAGLHGFELLPAHTMSGGDFVAEGRTAAKGKAVRANIHPTVKPTDLMAYLVRLVTPPGGVVLDPFMGSGSTGKAAIREGFRFIGCELSAEYMEIAKARIEFERIEAVAAANDEAIGGQTDLFGAAA